MALVSRGGCRQYRQILRHFAIEEGGHDRGVLAMGVLLDATWHHFKMDQGDPDHRAAFLNGEVPEDLTVLPASTPRN